jgi:hypothetical protein
MLLWTSPLCGRGQAEAYGAMHCRECQYVSDGAEHQTIASRPSHLATTLCHTATCASDDHERHQCLGCGSAIDGSPVHARRRARAMHRADRQPLRSAWSPSASGLLARAGYATPRASSWCPIPREPAYWLSEGRRGKPSARASINRLSDFSPFHPTYWRPPLSTGQPGPPWPVPRSEFEQDEWSSAPPVKI